MFDHPTARLPVPARVTVGVDKYLAPVCQQDCQKEHDPEEPRERRQPPAAAGSGDGIVVHDTREKTNACWLEKTRLQCGLNSRRRFSGCCTGRSVQPTRYFVKTSSQPRFGPFTVKKSSNTSGP